MNLQENIHRIQSMMGVITEDRKDNVIKNMIDDIGLYKTIKVMGGFDYSMEEYVSKEDKITFIKEIVEKLCEEYDDVEVGGPFFSGNWGIIYDENDVEKQIIEFYRPEYIIVERFTKEVDGAEYDYDDFYLGSFEIRYEELTHSLINEIFHLMLTKI